MTADPRPWQLYRHHFGDGSKKDWAYRQLPDGSIDIAWGRIGCIAHSQHYPANQSTAIEKRCYDKQRKGYVHLGEAVLRERLFEVISTRRIPLRHTPVPEPSHQPRIDLSWIAPGQENLWF